MVLWFKDSTGMPLYSLDFRNGPLIHWAMTDDLGSRTHFVLEESRPDSAHLAVKKVSLMDEGVFRCRVDFTDSPTRNQKVNLSILVSPNEPRIFDGQGREIAGVAGPFREEYDLYLSCQVTGGRPPPDVTWWHNSTMLESIDDTTSPLGTVTSQLFIGTVTRKLYAARLQCRAQVSELLPPVVKEVQLQVYLKPLMVHIVTSSDLVAASKPHTFRCETIGSHPVARLSWLLDGEAIRSQPVTVKTTGNTTSSVVTLVMAASDDGKGLTCRATNPWFPGGIMEDTRTINVAYPPRVTITVGSSDDPETLKEGGDVQIICNAEGRPTVDKYAWFRGGEQLLHNPSDGLVVLGRTMRIRNLTRADTGNYSCKAANSEGSTRSQLLALNILYVPVCQSPEPKETAAIRHSPLSLRCEIDSPPEAGPVKFSWTYNKTRDVLPIPTSLVSSEGTVSDLIYTPHSSADFGTLACWATNAAGHQKHPCLFSIVPAKVPEPPQECVLVNGSLVLEVSCRAGADGGIPQHFVLEVLPGVIPVTTVEPPLDIENEISTMNDQGTGPEVRPLYRESGGVPHFSLRGLRPGRRYGVMVYAVNARGRSPPATLKDIAVPEHYASADLYSNNQEGKTLSGEDRIITMSGSQSMAMIIGALGAAALLIILAIISASAVVICKRRRSNGEGSGFGCTSKNKRESASGPSMYASPDDENGFGSHFGAPNVMIRPCADIRRDGRRASRAISSLEALEIESQALKPGREEEIPMGTLNRQIGPFEIHDSSQYGVEKDFLPQRMNLLPQEMDIYAQVNKGYLNPQQAGYRMSRSPMNNYEEILQNYHTNSAWPGMSNYRQLGPLPQIPRMQPQDFMAHPQGMRTEPISRNDYEVMMSHAGLHPMSRDSREMFIDDSRRSSLDQRIRGSFDSGVSYRGMGVALQGLDILKGGTEYPDRSANKQESVGVNTQDMELINRAADLTQPLLENQTRSAASLSSPCPSEVPQEKVTASHHVVRFELDKPDLIISQPGSDSVTPDNT